MGKQFALIGRQGKDKDLIEKIDQGSRTYNGEYTDLTIEWQGIKLRLPLMCAVLPAAIHKMKTG